MVLVGVCCGTTSALATLWHELWHALEYYLPPGDLAAVDRAAAGGIALPGAYLDSAIERRARLAESWLSAYGEGWRPAALLGWPLRRVDRILLHLHSGRLARDVARYGAGRSRLGPLNLLGVSATYAVRLLHWLAVAPSDASVPRFPA